MRKSSSKKKPPADLKFRWRPKIAYKASKSGETSVFKAKKVKIKGKGQGNPEVSRPPVFALDPREASGGKGSGH
jgi:hypothetical protein